MGLKIEKDYNRTGVKTSYYRIVQYNLDKQSGTFFCNLGAYIDKSYRDKENEPLYFIPIIMPPADVDKYITKGLKTQDLETKFYKYLKENVEEWKKAENVFEK